MFGALRVEDGNSLTFISRSRNSMNYIKLLKKIERAIPKGAAWLNLIEAWWRMFRKQALARVDFADSYEIDQATRVATRQLNRKAKAWGWGREPKPPRHRRHTFVYRI